MIKSESPWSRKSSAQQHPNQRLEGKGVLQSRVRNWIGQCRAGWLLHSNYSLSTQQYNANLIYSCYCPHGVKFKDLNIKNIYIYHGSYRYTSTCMYGRWEYSPEAFWSLTKCNFPSFYFYFTAVPFDLEKKLILGAKYKNESKIKFDACWL